MNKAELIDAIASGSKLTKADAGRFGTPAGQNSTSPRSTLAAVAAEWNRLTENEQISWNDVAVNFPAKNKYGDIYTPSGYQVFMKLNSNLALINTDLLKSGPVANFPILPPIIPPSGDPPELLRFTFDGGIPEDINVLVYACAPVLRGSGFRKGKEKLLLAAPTNATGVIDCTYAYQNLFGQIKYDSTIYFRFVAVSVITGQTSVERTIRLINAPNIRVPRIGFYLPGFFVPTVSAGKDWITPFRVFGFNLTENLILHTDIDPAATFQISKNVIGPWVQTLSVPLNELKQPKQNVFYLKTAIAVANLQGSTITANSTGATQAYLGFGMQAIDQFISDPTIAIAFGDVYQGLFTPLEVAMPYGALRADIAFTLSGANADRFQLANDENGPWGTGTDLKVRGNGSSDTASIFIRVVPGATGALAATLNAVSGGDIANPFVVTADVIAGIFTSPSTPAIAYGNAITGERADGSFFVSGHGLASRMAVLGTNIVNCTIEFSEVFASVYSNPLATNTAGPTVTSKQIWYSIIPTVAGAFSADINIVASATNPLIIPISGTGV